MLWEAEKGGRVGQAGSPIYECSKKRTNFVWNAARNPLTNQPQTDVLSRKHDSREQGPLFCSSKLNCSSDRIMEFKPHYNDALMNQ